MVNNFTRAMLEVAKKHDLYQVEENFPIIPEALPIFSKASAFFLSINESCEPENLEGLMQLTSQYLWGKGVEAAFLWAKSTDGNISINFEPSEMINQTICTDLPEELEKIV